MDVRKYLVLSWTTFILGILVAILVDSVWSMLVFGLFTTFSGIYRARLPKQNPACLGEQLEKHPILKWFTVIYLLVVAGLSLNYIGELSEIHMKTNSFLLILFLFFPIFILWLREDYTLYVNSKKEP